MSIRTAMPHHAAMHPEGEEKNMISLNAGNQPSSFLLLLFLHPRCPEATSRLREGERANTASSQSRSEQEE